MEPGREGAIERKLFFILALGLIVAALFWGAGYYMLGRCYHSLSIRDGETLDKTDFSLEMPYPFPLRILTFTLDGRDISDRVQYADGKIKISLTNVSQGYHFLEIGFNNGLNPLTFLSRNHCAGFEVDTTSPVITLDFPKTKLVKQKDLYVIGKTEPSINYKIIVNNTAYTGSTDTAGNLYRKVTLDQETNKLQVFATDRAGNQGKYFKVLVLDENPPEITLEKIAGNDVIDSNQVELKAKVSDTGSGLEDCYFEIDNRIIPGKYFPDTGILTTRLDGLDEGGYKVEVVAKDRAGWKTKKAWDFVVDSQEELGDANIRPGAQGKDVEFIQNKLMKMGYLDKEKVTGTFGDETKQAILQVQKERGLDRTGIMDRSTYLAISEKIFVYLNEFSLDLISPDGKLVKKYSIACGSPYYPTPTGIFVVREKVYYPAWYPPNSPWAKGAKPIPPGPGNPLGTRWIGLNANVVGIHGTPSSWSIGSASSHGCIRMHISDVEELFELVNIGTPVTIFSSRPVEHKKFLPSAELDKAENTKG